MAEIYDEITLPLGSTIEEAVNLLLDYRQKKKLVCLDFNGVTLYSDEVTMNAAYMQIVGMTKEQFDDLYGGRS